MNPTPTWTTLDGRKIPLPRLSTTHLKNIINMLRRNGFVSVDEFDSLLSLSVSLHGEMAQMSAEQEVAGARVHALLDKLEAELETRSDK